MATATSLPYMSASAAICEAFADTLVQVSVVDDGLCGFTGDKQGWLQTHATNPHGYPRGSLRKLSLGEEVSYRSTDIIFTWLIGCIEQVSDFCQSGTLQV